MNAVREWLRSIRPERRYFKRDTIAGLPGAIASVPDGMASAVLAGVNPVHGLYASFAGPVAGGLTASTKLMVITTTTASALAAGSAVQHIDPADRGQAMALLTLIAGVAMILAGLARLGRYTRFVSHSVMIGFLTGVAVNIILGQIPDLVGVSSQGSIALTKAWNVLIHPSDIDMASLFVGLSAIALLVLVSRTRFAMVSALVALVVPTAVMILAGLDSVARVDDIAAIPRGIPLPQIPDFGLLSVSVVSGGLAVAAIVLVQGAGVASAAPNRDGSSTDANRDFLAQGVGNAASGLFRGQPVGGSVGQTSLNVTAGAKTRWGAIWSGIWMVIILVLFSGLVGKVAMPTLAALLILAGIGSIRPAEIMTILRTGPTSQIALIATFVATLLLPVTTAVGIGVVLSLLLQLNQEAIDLRVVELIPTPEGGFLETTVPARLTSRHATVLDVYGSLFYAGARTLQVRLPDPAGTESPVVVLRMRGRTTFGATFFTVMQDYAQRLADVNGRLYISGVDPVLIARATQTGSLGAEGPVKVFGATSLIGQSTHQALDEADAWIISRAEMPPSIEP
jgi:sulfate permease, SulP family